MGNKNVAFITGGNRGIDVATGRELAGAAMRW
jgi:NAD(P)-dependent dehydrogenase (short-subunit alcohol dehydrogenase family)